MKKLLLFITIIFLGTTTLSFAGFEMAARGGLGNYLTDTSDLESTVTFIKYGFGKEIEMGYYKDRTAFGLNFGSWRILKMKNKSSGAIAETSLIPLGLYARYDLIKNYLYAFSTFQIDTMQLTSSGDIFYYFLSGVGLGLGTSIPLSKKVFLDIRSVFHMMREVTYNYVDYALLSSAGLLVRF